MRLNKEQVAEIILGGPKIADGKIVLVSQSRAVKIKKENAQGILCNSGSEIFLIVYPKEFHDCWKTGLKEQLFGSMLNNFRYFAETPTDRRCRVTYVNLTKQQKEAVDHVLKSDIQTFREFFQTRVDSRLLKSLIETHGVRDKPGIEKVRTYKDLEEYWYDTCMWSSAGAFMEDNVNIADLDG